MSVNNSSVAVAQLCEAILYGLFLVTCWFSARTLLFRNTNQGVKLLCLHEIRVRWLLTTVSMMLFIICTWDMTIGIILSALMTAENPTGELDTPSYWIYTVRIVNQDLIILLCDFILIYRCWIVYGRRWRVIALSVILYFGIIPMAIKGIEIEVTSRTYESFRSNFHPWGTTMFGIHAVQNILTSGMLIWRIWRVGRRVDKNMNYPGGLEASPPRRMQALMRAFAESGAVYTTTVFATFLTSALKSSAFFVAVNTSMQTAGIVFNIIIVRSIKNDPEACIGDAGNQNRPIMATFPLAAQNALDRQIPILESQQSPCAPV